MSNSFQFNVHDIRPKSPLLVFFKNITPYLFFIYLFPYQISFPLTPPFFFYSFPTAFCLYQSCWSAKSLVHADDFFPFSAEHGHEPWGLEYFTINKYHPRFSPQPILHYQVLPNSSHKKEKYYLLSSKEKPLVNQWGRICDVFDVENNSTSDV